MKRVVNGVGKLKCGKWRYTILVLCATTAMALAAQTPTYALTFKSLHSFDYTDGYSPEAALVQATNGKVYGTTEGGGANGSGTIFTITANGTLTTVYNFCAKSGCADGQYPDAGLVQATIGNLYGTTVGGGANDGGTVFEITTNGALTTVYSFCAQSGCTDGELPHAGLIQATNGNLYGTTPGGGTDGIGTVFEITASGAEKTLHSFDGTDGADPDAGLVQATNGYLYGTAGLGGASDGGTVFKITPNGALTTLYNFCSESECADGANPGAGLVLATNGYLYGTTYDGGVGANRAGTFFKITPNGTLTTLYTFDYTDGGFPVAGLIQGINGKLFGTTEYGGANGDGTIFNITPNGTPTTLYSFCSESDCADGEVPQAALVQVTHGTLHALYGTTTQGGANGDGTVFGLFGP